MPETPDTFNEKIKNFAGEELKKYVAALAGILAIKMLILRWIAGVLKKNQNGLSNVVSKNLKDSYPNFKNAQNREEEQGREYHRN